MHFKKSPVLVLCLFLTYFAQAQTVEWQSIASFPGAARSNVISFVIGDTAYVGLGKDAATYYTDFYKYDPSSNQWTQIADFAGSGRSGAVSFVAGGKAYVGTGRDSGSTLLKDFYQYDPNTGQWTAITDFPGVARNLASSFSINGLGYVGLGMGATDEQSDFYQYDPSNDTWTAIQGLDTTLKRKGANGFAINGMGYIVAGNENENTTFTAFTDVQAYDPGTDSWTEKVFADSKLGTMANAAVYVADDGKAYMIGSGSSGSTVVYDPMNNSLTDFTPYYASAGRYSGTAFYVGGTAYAGLGYISNYPSADQYFADFYQKVTIYPPNAPEIIEVQLNTDGSGYEKTAIQFKDNATDEEGFLLYLSQGDTSNYQLVDSIPLHSNTGYITHVLDSLQQGVHYFAKLVAYKGALVSIAAKTDFYPKEYHDALTPQLAGVQLAKGGKFQLELSVNLYNEEYIQDILVVSKLDTGTFGNSMTYLTSDWQNKNHTLMVNGPNTYSDSIFYRIRCVGINNDTSAYSNIKSIGTSGFGAYVGNIISISYQDYGSSYFSIQGVIDSLERVRNYSLFVSSDGVSYSKASYSSYNPAGTFSFKNYGELDTLYFKFAGANAFGSDTSSVGQVILPPYKPSKLRAIYATSNVLGVAMQVNSHEREGIVVERKIEGGNFAVYDTLYTEGSNVEYYDEQVVAGTRYYYRFANYKGQLISSYSDSVGVRAQAMSPWKKYEGDGLQHVLDSISNFSLDKKLLINNSFYFIAPKYHKLYQYDLNAQSLTQLADFPSLSFEVNQLWETRYFNGKIYCFGGVDKDYNRDREVAIYDIASDTWTQNVSLPSTFDEVQYVIAIDATHVLVAGRDTNGKLMVAPFDTQNQSWGTNKIIDQYTPTLQYAYMDGDSLIMYSYNNRISYNTLDQNAVVKSIQWEQSINHDQLGFSGSDSLYISGNRVYNFHLDSVPTLTKSGFIPFDQPQGRLFFKGDTLMYGLQRDDRLTSSTKNGNSYLYHTTALLYYRDVNAPLPIAGLKADSMGYDHIDISWIDAPNESQYIVALTQVGTDSVFVQDTIAANSTSYSFTSLPDRTYFNASVTSLNATTTSNPTGLAVKTIDGTPPKLINLQGIPLDEKRIQYTWDKVDLNRVDTIKIYFPFEDKLVALSASDTVYVLSGLDENTQVSGDFYTSNQYGENFVTGIKSTTFLIAPQLNQIVIRENQGAELHWADQSAQENWYGIYRAKAGSGVFGLIDSLSSAGVSLGDEMTYLDASADLTKDYDYEVKALLYNSDNTLANYSESSNPQSTKNAVLGIEDHDISSSLSVYPNPVHQKLTLKVSNAQIERVRILSLSGKEIMNFHKPASSSLDVSQLKDGLYLLKVYTDKGSGVMKFVKQ